MYILIDMENSNEYIKLKIYFYSLKASKLKKKSETLERTLYKKFFFIFYSFFFTYYNLSLHLSNS